MMDIITGRAPPPARAESETLYTVAAVSETLWNRVISTKRTRTANKKAQGQVMEGGDQRAWPVLKRNGETQVPGMMSAACPPSPRLPVSPSPRLPDGMAAHSWLPFPPPSVPTPISFPLNMVHCAHMLCPPPHLQPNLATPLTGVPTGLLPFSR